MDNKTHLLHFFELVGEHEFQSAKRLIVDVNKELEYLETASVGLQASANTLITDIKKLVINIESGHFNAAWGKFNPLQARYMAILDNPLKDRRDQLSNKSCQKSEEAKTASRGSFQYKNDSKTRTEKKTSRQHTESEKREEFNPNIYQQPADDDMRDKFKETLTLDKSKRASQRLRYKNPDITDLSDSNRPTKLAERFSELYDNEWTEAYEAMSKVKPRDVEEKQIIEFFLKIVENAYQFCSENETPLKERLREGKIVQVDERNQCAASEIQSLQKQFCDVKIPEIARSFTIKTDDTTEQYAKKAVELAYWMNLQDPPVHMVFSVQSNNKFDPNLYRAYTKSGREAAFLVWPPLTLYKGGGVLCKGVVQCK